MRSQLIALVILLGTAEDDAWGQVKVQREVPQGDQYAQASQRTAEVVRERMRPHLSAEQQRTLDKVGVVVEPNSWSAYQMRAAVDDTPPTTRVPLGLIYIVDYVDSAIAAAEAASVSWEQVARYVTAVADGVKRATSRDTSGYVSVYELPDFPSFARMTRARWDQISSSAEYRARKDVIKLSTFSVLLGHELWHHLNPGAHADSAEILADRFAADISVRSSLNPILAFPAFLFLAALEEANGISRKAGAHETSLCRAIYFFEAGRAAMVSDEEFTAYMKSSGSWRNWEQFPQSVRRILAEDGVRCPEIAQVDDATANDDRTTERLRLAVSVVSWPPTPGQCNGVELEVEIDGEYAATIANMEDTDAVDVGELEVGEHQFSLKGIAGYCIEPFAPYRTRRYMSNRSCSGKVRITRAGLLRIALRTTTAGRIVECSLREAS